MIILHNSVLTPTSLTKSAPWVNGSFKNDWLPTRVVCTGFNQNNKLNTIMNISSNLIVQRICQRVKDKYFVDEQ